MTTEERVQWSFEADYFQACSCDYGCPCEFEAPPTQGFCEGVGAYRINQGSYGSVPLDGLGLGLYVRFPEAMHLGNGSLGLFIDERADALQREALVQIASGQQGGVALRGVSGSNIQPGRASIRLVPIRRSRKR